MPFFVETVFPKGAHVRISLIVALTIETFEYMGYSLLFFVLSFGGLILVFCMRILYVPTSSSFCTGKHQSSYSYYKWWQCVFLH